MVIKKTTTTKKKKKQSEKVYEVWKKKIKKLSV